MRILITGAAGMLGSQLVAVAAQRGHIPLGFTRESGNIASYLSVFNALRHERPDIVINAAGVIMEKASGTVELIQADALGPQMLAEACNAEHVPLVHVSTDCVFAGRRPWPERYGTTDEPDAVEVYGRAKALGEPDSAVVVRTSFVGARHGLWAWVARQAPGTTIPGWAHAYWSGSLVDVVAEALIDIAEAPPEPGIYHLATRRPIAKLDAVMLLASAFTRGVSVERAETPVLNRALEPTPGMILPPFADALSAYLARAVHG